jgi:hypothetical protein
MLRRHGFQKNEVLGQFFFISFRVVFMDIYIQAKQVDKIITGVFLQVIGGRSENIG